MDWTATSSAIVGAAIVLVSQLALRFFEEWPRKRLDKKRKILLQKMLQPKNMPLNKNGKPTSWRTFQTLRDVIGADDETAKRLLIEIGARRATKNKDVWALEVHQPICQSMNDDDSLDTEPNNV